MEWYVAWLPYILQECDFQSGTNLSSFTSSSPITSSGSSRPLSSPRASICYVSLKCGDKIAIEIELTKHKEKKRILFRTKEINTIINSRSNRASKLRSAGKYMHPTKKKKEFKEGAKKKKRWYLFIYVT